MLSPESGRSRRRSQSKASPLAAAGHVVEAARRYADADLLGEFFVARRELAAAAVRWRLGLPPAAEVVAPVPLRDPVPGWRFYTGAALRLVAIEEAGGTGREWLQAYNTLWKAGARYADRLIARGLAGPAHARAVAA